MKTRLLPKKWLYLIIGVLIVPIVAVLALAISDNLRSKDPVDNTIGRTNSESPKELLEDHGVTPLDSAQASNAQVTADDLVYIIEEEKLAHDVYQAMYDKWGALDS